MAPACQRRFVHHQRFSGAGVCRKLPIRRPDMRGWRPAQQTHETQPQRTWRNGFTSSTSPTTDTDVMTCTTTPLTLDTRWDSRIWDKPRPHVSSSHKLTPGSSPPHLDAAAGENDAHVHLSRDGGSKRHLDLRRSRRRKTSPNTTTMNWRTRLAQTGAPPPPPRQFVSPIRHPPLAHPNAARCTLHAAHCTLHTAHSAHPPSACTHDVGGVRHQRLVRKQRGVVVAPHLRRRAGIPQDCTKTTQRHNRGVRRHADGATGRYSRRSCHHAPFPFTSPFNSQQVRGRAPTYTCAATQRPQWRRRRPGHQFAAIWTPHPESDAATGPWEPPTVPAVQQKLLFLTH